MGTPSFSVIIPVYNTDIYLEECVDSVLTQSFNHFELFLVDDGSTDLSEEICDYYAVFDQRTVVVHKKNGGVSSSRNIVLKICTGDYLSFIDADDHIEGDFLQKFSMTLNKYSNVSQVWCGYSRERFDIKTHYMLPDIDGIVTCYLRGYMELSQKNLSQICCNKVYRRSCISKNSILFNESMTVGEDWLFNINYLNFQNVKAIIFINQPLYNYRYVEGSATNKYQPKFLENHILLYRRLAELLQKWRVDENQWQLYYNAFYNIYEMALFNTCSSENRISFSRKMAFNNAILKSPGFHTVLNRTNIHIHPIFRIAYRLKKFELIYYINKLRDKIRYNK